MKLTRDPPRHDPVKEAIYNPKEFRGRRATGADWSANSRAGWGSIFLLVIDCLHSQRERNARNRN